MGLFFDLIGATSARTEPRDNMYRAISVLSQVLREVPVDVDLAMTGPVGKALSRDGVDVTNLDGNKTGQFSGTLMLTSGMPVPVPFPVNDVWVGRIYDVTEKQLADNPSLHEVMAVHQTLLTKWINENSPQKIPHQPWQTQARNWVQLRTSDQGVDTPGCVGPQ